MTNSLFLTFLLVTAVLLGACGHVVTPEPTRASSPTDAPTATSTTRRVTGSTADPPSIPMLDTATPTITPTPIVHVVQQGDTLQAIAFDFGVSVATLQRANGIENPQFLQVGQRLVIPINEDSDQTASGLLLLPTPTPHSIRVQGMALYETPVEGLLGLGEVVNTTSITLTNVQVRVALLNATDDPLAETDVFISMDILPPGGRSPFSALFITPPRGWVSYQVNIIRAQEAGAMASAYVPVEVVDLDGGPRGSQFHVQGVVTNASDGRVAESIEVFVTTYDAEGAVTGFRRIMVPAESFDGGIPPGAEKEFSLSLTTHGDVPYDVTATSLGRATDGITSGG